jgi:cell division septum initiation protein DivIVA
MNQMRISLALVCVLMFGCTQVPKESVELSATVGRDIAKVHHSHRELVKVVYDRMRADVNRFVDDVYAPYQIRFVMKEEVRKRNSNVAEDKKKSLLLLIDAAFKEGADPRLQNATISAMSAMGKKIRADVESMRADLLKPLNDQETELLGAIDRSYNQIHYANSIVTGHLSSVAKVHEVQNELLEAIGVDINLREEIGTKLANAAEKVGDLVDSAEKGLKTLDDAKKKGEEIRAAIKGD